MRKKNYRRVSLTVALVVGFLQLSAQYNRAQYPRFLSKSFIGVNMGYINYPFSALQMEPGFKVESIRVPHLAVQVLLLGHHFNKYLSAQISYMRPVKWIEYKNVNGDQYTHTVWMNVAGFTVKASLPVMKRFSISGEGGLSIITRKGFKLGDIPVVLDANYASVLLGAGIQYHLNNKWDLKISAAYSPPHTNSKQPYTVFYSTGFNYTMRTLSPDRVEKNSTTGFKFPRNLIQLGYSTNHYSYGVNDFVSKGAIPIFWGGDAEVEQGVSLQYQRNIFHGRKLFSLDWGTNLSFWKSRKNKNQFYTLSVFPLFRFSFLRTKPADLYFYYSVAGPTFISRTTIDSVDTGKRFTFQDLMGLGTFAGKNRQLNAEVRIGHYSNGNIFPYNGGVKIPLTFNLGYTF